jgi:predicted RNase H-like nuclease
MTKLLVGFDSAWTAGNSGGLVGVLSSSDGSFRELGEPRNANFDQAQDVIREWQREHSPNATVIFLDQPTIVVNATGQRPVENLVGAAVSRRYGGVQPAYTGRLGMFCEHAPVWSFLRAFGGPADPLSPLGNTSVFETYPVLTIVAYGWTLPDSHLHARTTGRLPKYNPERATFSFEDWQHVCRKVSGEFKARGLLGIATWMDGIATQARVRKEDQDRLDACICLLAALHLAESKDCLMVGDMKSGNIVVPDNTQLRMELNGRCELTGRLQRDMVRVFVAEFAGEAHCTPVSKEREHLASG